MSKLKAVDPKTTAPKKPKVLIYGKPGVGKTWAALDFPSVYYMDMESGATRSHYTDKLKASGGAYFGVEQGSLDFKEVIEQVKALATEDHTYRTLVLDSFTKLYLTEAAKAAESGGDDFGRDRKEANKPTKQLLMWLDKLDMNVLMICHEKAEWGLDAKGNRSEIGRTFDGFDKLDYELDLCLNILKQGQSRKSFVKKSRLQEFPEATMFDWSYASFADRYGRAVMEGEAKKIVLSTPEQLADLAKLLEIVKLEDGQIEKWFNKAKVSDFKEMDTDTIAKIIDYLKKKKEV